MSGVAQLNLSAEIWGLVFSVVCIFCVCLLPAESKKLKSHFLRMFLVNTIFMASDILGMLLDGTGGPGRNILLRIIYTVDFASSFLLLTAFADYLICVISLRGETDPRWRKFLLFVGSAAALSCVINLFVPFYFRIDGNNHYARTGIVWIFSQILALIMILTVSALILRHRRSLDPVERICFLLYTCIPVLSAILQLKVPVISFFNVATTLLLMVCFLWMQHEITNTIRKQDVQMKVQEAELTESRSQIMMTQIQPHFLYNSLNTIYYLCEKDPALAQKAVGDFSDYLRTNLNSLKFRDPVPFEKELQHVKTYLWLEQLRFDDRLKVYYNITCVNFRIPILTIQPLVENAVKHGICNRPEGGSIEISTRETEEFYEITVIDNGVGFDPDRPPEDGKEHIGIENVRRRLKLEAGGTLMITSKINVGTTSQVRLPKEI